VRTLFTINDQQTRLRIDIYQGEASLCSKNTHLGGLELSVPPRKAGEVRVDVRLTYDVNGILDVDIDSEEAGVKRNLVIKKLAGEVSDDEIERRRRELAALRIHPRDEDENRLVLERAERLFEQLLGAERERVGDYLKQFTLILERQDPHEIRVARGEFARALDGLERGSPW
jgi:molecular chaperone HscC